MKNATQLKNHSPTNHFQWKTCQDTLVREASPNACQFSQFFGGKSKCMPIFNYGITCITALHALRHYIQLRHFNYNLMQCTVKLKL